MSNTHQKEGVVVDLEQIYKDASKIKTAYDRPLIGCNPPPENPPKQNKISPPPPPKKHHKNNE